MEKKNQTTQVGSGKIRTTIFVESDSIEELDYIARHEAMSKNETVTRTDLINQGIKEVIKRWKNKNGEIPKR